MLLVHNRKLIMSIHDWFNPSTGRNISKRLDLSYSDLSATRGVVDRLLRMTRSRPRVTVMKSAECVVRLMISDFRSDPRSQPQLLPGMGRSTVGLTHVGY